MRARLALLLAAASLLGARADFHEGEYVPTSRRSLFHSQRTGWHDLLGRHCPRFGKPAVVSVPLPRPTGLKVADNYRIQLTFDGDRLLTPWLRLVGQRVQGVPGLEVALTRTGSHLAHVDAKVRPLPAPYLAQHPALAAEWGNATHWPKHLLVRYSWRHRHSVDALGGLYLTFAAGLLAVGVIGVSTLATYDKKLRAFMADLTAEEEEGVPPGGQAAAGGPHLGPSHAKAAAD